MIIVVKFLHLIDETKIILFYIKINKRKFLYSRKNFWQNLAKLVNRSPKAMKTNGVNKSYFLDMCSTVGLIFLMGIHSRVGIKFKNLINS